MNTVGVSSGGEWSFAQTLTHRVLATECGWAGRSWRSNSRAASQTPG